RVVPVRDLRDPGSLIVGLMADQKPVVVLEHLDGAPPGGFRASRTRSRSIAASRPPATCAMTPRTAPRTPSCQTMSKPAPPNSLGRTAQSLPSFQNSAI